MHLEKIKIENFRGISHAEYDFTDELGRVNKLTLIVGPNGSGKSSILDAIWFGLKSVIGYPMLRQSFRENPEFIVRTGRNYTKVEYRLRIEPDEMERTQSWKQELINLDAYAHSPRTESLQANITWTYPAQLGYREERYGGYRYHNDYDWDVVSGEQYARKLKRLKAGRLHDAHFAGSVYFFEQERQIIDTPVYSVPSQSDADDELYNQDENNIRRQLIDLGIRAQLGNLPPDDIWYNKIRDGYNYICSPNRMGNVIATSSDGEYGIEFTSGDDTNFSFNGLSSGERSVLNFLVQYYSKRMFNSIILIDELEMHLHPIWQRRLLQYLQAREDGNQLIVTTHSPTIRNYISEENTITLGEIDDLPQPAWYVEESS